MILPFDELVDPGCFEVGRIKNVAEEGMKPVNFGDILATLYHTQVVKNTRTKISAN